MNDRSVDPLTVAIPFYKGHAYLRGRGKASFGKLRLTGGWSSAMTGPERHRQLVASFGDSRIRYQKNERNLSMAGNWNHCLDVADTTSLISCTTMTSCAELRRGNVAGQA